MTAVLPAVRPSLGRTEPSAEPGVTGTWVARLGELVAQEGLRAHQPAVARVARAGRALAPVAAAVLTDEGEPEVARLRAFAVVSVAIAKHQSPGR